MVNTELSGSQSNTIIPSLVPYYLSTLVIRVSFALLMEMIPLVSSKLHKDKQSS